MFNNFINKVYNRVALNNNKQVKANKESASAGYLLDNNGESNINSDISDAANSNEDNKFFQVGDGMINLASNESMLGVSPKVIDALKELIMMVYQYPDATAIKFRAKVAEFYGIDPNNIICGNGSEEVIFNICRAMLRNRAGVGDEVISSSMSFPLYEVATLLQAGVFIELNNCDNPQSFHVDQVLKAITDRTKVIFLDNPTNPGGGYINNDELRYLAKKTPDDVLLVVDSAYAEYISPFEDDYNDGLNLVLKHPNVMVVKTFSKAYGLAGVRVGWGYANKSVNEKIQRFIMPFNVNALGLKLAQIALTDQEFLNKNVYETKRVKDKIIKEINNHKFDFTALNTFANFFLIKAKSKECRDAIHECLMKNGLFTRKLLKLNNYLRITIAKEKIMSKLVDVLKKNF